MDFIHRSTILFFATGAGAGYSPWMPGTVGTAVAIPLSLALNRLAETSLPLSLLTLGAFTLSAAWFSAKGEEIFKEKDSEKIVIDEIAGFLFANFLSPTEVNNLAVAFLLFRVFDIIKVYPAGRAESIRGGFGVILDDVIAGLYTFLIVHLLLFWGLL
jgi:phosphatidylglycerophosphatase A